MNLFHRSLLAAGLALLIAAPVAATTITFGADNRPVLFEGVTLNGTTFDVTVTWGSAYNAVYSAQPPRFLGNEPGAHDALQALVGALVDNGYVSSPLQSYLNVPYVNGGTLATSWGADLYYATPLVLQVANYTYQFYSNTGFTVWTVTDPVKTESTTWGRIKSLYQR